MHVLLTLNLGMLLYTIMLSTCNQKWSCFEIPTMWLLEISLNCFILLRIIGLEFEVMDTYKTENDDELELSPGDKVVVLSKNMDGWWKIK